MANLHVDDVVLELHMRDLAGTVHEAVESVGTLGFVPDPFASLFATWDTLVNNPIPVDDGDINTYIKHLAMIHRQVDAVLNGEAVIVIKEE